MVLKPHGNVGPTGKSRHASDTDDPGARPDVRPDPVALTGNGRDARTFLHLQRPEELSKVKIQVRIPNIWFQA